MRFLSLAIRNMKEVYRDPVTMIMGIGMPAALLLVFMAIQKNMPVEIFSPQSLTPAIVVFSFSFLCIFSAILVAKDRETAFITRLLASPLSSTDFILAYSLPFLPIALLQTIVGYFIGILYGVDPSWSMVISLIVLIPIAIAFIGIGMILGSVFSVNQAPGVGSIVIVATSFLGGAWMDLQMVGGTVEQIGYALPFAHAIDATRGIVNGTGVASVAGDIYWVIGYAVLFFVLGVLCFRWKTRQ